MINSYPRTIAYAALPAGLMAPYGGTSAPSGWLLCDGAAVSRTTYAGLFAVLGTAFGAGDGSTTFNVPDLRGRYPLGKDDMGGSSANRVTATQADNIGQGSGAENHTLSTSEIPAHSHVVRTQGVTSNASRLETTYSLSVSYSEGFSSEPAGGGGAHNNMPPYQTVNYIVKT